MMIAKPIKGTLIFFSGKMGAGKSTYSVKIAAERMAVLLSEDEWLASLYPDKIETLQDYVQYSNLLKPPMKELTQSILNSGTDVVMDYPANTLQQREWFRDIFSEINANHELLYLDAADDTYLERIAKRRMELGRHTDTEEMFAAVTKHFVPPSEEEGFAITRLDAGDWLFSE